MAETFEIIDAGPALVVGAGLAGLFAALTFKVRPVTILAGSPIGSGASSAWAQGGIAAAMGGDDSPALHAADTIVAGAGIVDEAVAKLVTEDAAARIDDLVRLGAPFDRDGQGRLVLGREAAHGKIDTCEASGLTVVRSGDKRIATARLLIWYVNNTHEYVAIQLTRDESRSWRITSPP